MNPVDAMMTRLKRHTLAFCRDESGLLLAEALIMLPLMIWTFVAMFVYWDVFRTINVVQKAGYSVADLLSRQEVVTEDFLNGLEEVMEFLVPNAPNVGLRITSMQWNDTTDEFDLLWSHSTTVHFEPRDQGSIQLMKDRIPFLEHQEAILVVETWVEFVPRFNTGLLNVAPMVTENEFGNFIITKPRHRRVCLDGTSTCT
jgi:hypothetical protein